MAFAPSSTIYLCNVPFDGTYTNQIYFASQSEQQAYFIDRVQKTFTNYLTVRRTPPNGGAAVSSVKVDANIDDLYGCNYIFYQNANHGSRYFYAFITQLVYINEGTTEIYFETDVYQTWLFDVELLPSYVVREHSETDGRGEHIVPERININDYFYVKYPDGITTVGEWGYLIASSQEYSDDGSEEYDSDVYLGGRMSGIYQGLYFYYFTGETTALYTFMLNVNPENIISISIIPRFNLSGSSIGRSDAMNGEGQIMDSTYVPSRTISLDIGTINDFDGYVPKNNKLFTSPYCKLIVTNNSGDEAEYALEDFAATAAAAFKVYGDISINPSLTLIPQNHQGVAENYPAGISIKNFPQCAFNTDMFKLWMTKNQYGTGISALTSLGQIVGGAAMTATGAGAAAGVGMIAAGASGILGTFNSVYQASKEPNRTNSGNVQNNLLTAMGRNKFDFYIRKIKPEHARTIDDYFTMYGYQTNCLKVPNVSSRPYFNYVQTNDCNISGGIPAEDMKRLKDVYNHGVTLWKPSATIGNYAVDNSPNE